VASLADGDDFENAAGDGTGDIENGLLLLLVDGQKKVAIGEEQYRLLLKQLADCRDLLSESEGGRERGNT